MLPRLPPGIFALPDLIPQWNEWEWQTSSEYKKLGLIQHPCYATLVARLPLVRKDGKVQKQKGPFGTSTQELMSLREWLCPKAATIWRLALVHWKAFYSILFEGTLAIVVANAQPIKKVPGRQADVTGAEWIADLPPRAARLQLGSA